ncbi:MAG: HU family DNA-binding protein [Candidatus Adiutrix sp.]|jgi:nucleoid DNA-binding protein|nr:HU family DNA-binding protein [Candidatus Adiutrix sp.]
MSDSGRRPARTPPLTRREVVDRLTARLGLSAREAGLILDDFLEIIAARLEEGAAASLRGLGRFDTALSPARVARNPRTGAEAQAPARRRAVFALSRTLREEMKKNLASEPEND